MLRKILKFVGITAVTLVLLPVALAVAGLPLYVFPAQPDVERADLIYVIGPPQRDRIAMERELRAQGYSELSLYSVSLHGGWSAPKLRVCREEGVVCVHPEPFSTKGEIAYLEKFAADHDVKRTIILTFTPHVARTRFILQKCFDGDATVVPVDQHLGLGEWVYQYFYQSAAFVKAWLTPCADPSDL